MGKGKKVEREVRGGFDIKSLSMFNIYQRINKLIEKLLLFAIMMNRFELKKDKKIHLDIDIY